MVDTKTLERYRSILAAFMSYTHGRSAGNVYPRDENFTIQVLAAITPQQVANYMKMMTFGSENPAPDANPTGRRSNTLSFVKKALSFFMPNREKWSVTRMEGNPTMSQDVNDLIKRVKKKEARKQGAESKTWRPMNNIEFDSLHDVLKRVGDTVVGRDRDGSHGGTWKRYGIAALVNLQFHLIARIDDSTQVVLEHIRVHDRFPSCLKTRLNWSKNVTDERDAPWQIVFGSIKPEYCVLSSLGLWLELNLRTYPPAMVSPYAFAFTDDNRIPEGGVKSKSMVSRFLTQTFKLDAFKKDDGEARSLLLGSHSICKYAATYAHCCGVTKDEKDIRGRWKGQGRVSDIYDDVELPYPDAKVAAILCGGGPCYYTTDAMFDTAMVDQFVLSHVVPNVRK